MRPLSLRLRGILRYDDLDLDLRDVGPGLIAITGSNGEGKTTALETLGPTPLYLDFPTRPRPLKDYATRRDALIELTQEWKGHEYRHVVQVDPQFGGDRGKVEAFLFRDGAPLAEHPTPGRVGDYERAIAALFPPRSVFLASAYSAQGGRHDFFALSTAERRDLFTALLGNAHLQEIAARAEEQRKALDATVADLEEQIARLEGTAAILTEAEAEIARLEPESGLRAHEVQQREETWQALEAERARLAAALEEAETRRAEWRRRCNALGTQIAEDGVTEGRLREELAGLDHKATGAGPLRATVERLRAEVERGAAADGDRRAVEADAHRIQDALRHATEQLKRSRAGLDAVPKIEERIAQLEEQDRAPVPDVAALDRRLAALRGRHTKAHAGSHGDLSRIGTELARAQADVELLDKVPCGGRVLFVDDAKEADAIDCATCPLLKGAMAAGERIPVLERAQADAEEAAVDAARLFAEIQTLDAERAEATTTATARQQRAERLTELRRKLTEASAAADDEPHWAKSVATLEEESAVVRERLAATATTTATFEQARRQLAEAEASLRAADDAAAALPGIRARAQDAVDRTARVRTELAALEAAPVLLPADLQNEALAATTKASEARQALHAARSTAATTRDALQAARGRASLLREQLGGLAAVREQRQAQALRRAGYRLLERGFGRDGVQALEIDAAGPAVSDLVNELLGASFGPRFRTALQTVRPAEGARKAREVFDVLIYDGDRDPRPRRIEDVSGGERVLVSEALKCAIALLNTQRHGLQVETLWRDEADGALDHANALRYPAMLRRAMELGGFKRCFFVTHRQDVADQADTLLEVKGGTITCRTLR